MDKSRTDFEAWASQDGFDIYRNGEADYFNPTTQYAWEGWQASCKQTLEAAAAACESIEQAKYVEDRGFGDFHLHGAASGASECADAIRSLEGNAKEMT